MTIESAAEADRAFSMLMGDEVPPRREFIESHARYAKIDFVNMSKPEIRQDYIEKKSRLIPAAFLLIGCGLVLWADLGILALACRLKQDFNFL